MKGYATLHSGLIARRDRRRESSDPPSPELLRALEESESQQEAPEHQLDREGHALAPSASLSANLISAGRAAYRAERQRQAQKTSGLTSRGEILGVLSGWTERPSGSPQEPQRAEAPKPLPLPPYSPDRPSPSWPLRRLVPPAAPTEAEKSEVAEAAHPAPSPRRRAVTLRLRPEQHASLLGIRRRLGCSFQVLVVRALTDHLAALEREPQRAMRARAGAGEGAPTATPISSSELAAELAGAGRAPGLQGTPDVHFFTLPSGWYVAAWQQERGGEAATPSEVLGKVLRAHGLADLIAADRGEQPLESISLGDGGHRVALTIRLEADLHQRLQEAREKLGRTGQDILLDAINAYIEG